jgi:hypothetical protein
MKQAILSEMIDENIANDIRELNIAATRAAAKNRQQQASASDTTELTGTTQAAS